MDWTSTYKSRVVTPQEAVRAIKSGNHIFLTGNVSVPQKVLAALVEYAPQLENVEIYQALTVGSADYVSPAMEGHLRINSIFISNNIRKAVHEGRADFTPVLLAEFPLLFKRGLLPLDVAMIHVSPPDEHGFCSLGVEVGLTKTPAESAKIIIAEVNEQMPRTLGDSFIHVSRLNYIVPVDYPISELPMSEGESSQVVEKIAGNIAELIPINAVVLRIRPNFSPTPEGRRDDKEKLHPMVQDLSNNLYNKPEYIINVWHFKVFGILAIYQKT